MYATLYSATHTSGHLPPTREYAAAESNTVYTCMISEPSGSPPFGQMKYGQCTHHTPYPLRHVPQFDNFTTDLPAHWFVTLGDTQSEWNVFNLNMPRGVLWGPQRVIFCDPAVTISTNLILIFVCVPHQVKINIM